MYIPNVTIKDYSNDYESEVKDILMSLKKYYPDIEKWWDKKESKKINEGRDKCLIVLDKENNVVGIAISGFEREGIAKLKTFKLTEGFGGYSLGVVLLKKVLNYWMKKRVRRIFVTFAEEELEELRGFFDKFGFLLDGIEPHFYRPGKTEYHMSKTFFYDTIDKSDFVEFIKNNLLRVRGIITESENDESVAYQDTGFSYFPRSVYVKIITKKNIDENELYKQVENEMNKNKCVYSIIVSYYSLDNMPDEPRIRVIDGFQIEKVFYPFQLKRGGSAGIMLPIKEEYARELLDIDEPQQSIMKKRLLITHDKHYFSGHIEKLVDIKRGCTFIFYQMKGENPGGIIGEAKIKRLSIEDVKGVFKKHGLEKSAFTTEDELMKHSNKGKIALFLLTCVKRYPRKIPTNEIYQIFDPDSVDFQAQSLNDNQIGRIRESGENILEFY